MFPVAWTALYILIGLALAMILNARGSRLRGVAIALFAMQMVLNLAWTPLFFGAHQVTAAFWLIVFMFVISIATTLVFGRIRKAAAWLMVPYLAWLCFAGMLDCGHRPAQSRRRNPCAVVGEHQDDDLIDLSRDSTMQSENRLFDDFVKFVNGAAGTLAGMGREAEAATRERAREWIGGMDFVSRDEFEAVKAMAAAARDEADALKARLDELEAQIATKAPAKPKPASKAGL